MKKFILCWLFGYHEWTSKSMKGIEPITLDLDGFCDYNKMYCDRCGKESEISKEFLDKYKEKWKDS